MKTAGIMIATIGLSTIAAIGTSAATVPSVALVYRYNNATSFDHFYTANYSELHEGASGYLRENNAGTFMIPTAQTDASYTGTDRTPFYRFAKGTGYSSIHYYTTNKSEGLNAGYSLEGTLGFIHKTNIIAGMVPLHRYVNIAHSTFPHFYTVDFSELQNGNGQWTYEGIMGYVWPSPTAVAPGDAADLTNLGVSNWTLTTQSNGMHAQLSGLDAAGNQVATFTVDSTASSGGSGAHGPFTVTASIPGTGVAHVSITSAGGPCDPIDNICHMTITGSVEGNPFTTSFYTDFGGNVRNGTFTLADATELDHKPVYIAMGIGEVFRLLPALTDAFCLSCIGSVVVKVLKVSGSFVGSGAVKVAARVVQIFGGNSTASCILQGALFAAEAYGCGASVVADAPTAGAATGAVIIACSLAATSAYTFSHNCGGGQ